MESCVQQVTSSIIDGRRLWAGAEGAGEKAEFLDTAEIVEVLDSV